jgi:hypothetical protein
MIAVFVSVIGFGLTACEDLLNEATHVAVMDIIDVPSTATVGIPLSLSGTVVPPNATNQIIFWSVQNAGTTGATIATGSNVLNTTAIGTVTVGATIINGESTTTSFNKDFTITVSDVGFVAVADIIGIPATATAETPLTLSGTVTPSNATNQTIIWSVQNAGNTGATIATGSNVLNTTAAGTVIVGATIANGASATTNFTKDFTITVNAETTFVAVTDISGIPDTATVGAPLVLTGIVRPSNATNQTIIWSVQNAGNTGATIATGSNILNTTSAGTVIVGATIANGASATTNFTRDFTITVNAETTFVPVTDITGVPTTTTVGTSLTLNGIVTPSNATNQTIVWSILPGTTNATINGNILFANAAGRVIVIATIIDGTAPGTNFTRNFEINVYAATITVPTAPQNFRAMPGDRQVQLSWDAPSNNGGSPIIGYELIISDTDGNATTVNITESNRYTSTDLINGSLYTFIIRAINEIGGGAEAIVTAIPGVTSGGGSITIAIDIDGDFRGLPRDIELSRSGEFGDSQVTIDLNTTPYTSAEWYVNGVLRQSGGSYTLRAVDFNNGTHRLGIFVVINGHLYSREVRILVQD